MLRRLAVLTSALAIASAAFAQPIVPREALYEATESEADNVVVCQLMLALTDSSRETVSFIAAVGLNRDEELPFAGFRIGAGDLAGGADSGEILLTDLASAGYSSPGFNSAGLYQEVDVDSSVWTWIEEPDQASAFLDSLMPGGFEIIFTRAAADSPIRRYRVSAGPPEDVRASFVGCVERLFSERSAMLAPGPAIID